MIFFAVFIGFACIQFWTIDANEVANAFTYGGNTITQYPMTVYPREIVAGADLPAAAGLRQLVPRALRARQAGPVRLARVASASPHRVAALVLALLAWLVWRAGVRHYTSTGS